MFLRLINIYGRTTKNRVVDFFFLGEIQLQQNLNYLDEYVYFNEIIAGNMKLLAIQIFLFYSNDFNVSLQKSNNV